MRSCPDSIYYCITEMRFYFIFIYFFFWFGGFLGENALNCHNANNGPTNRLHFHLFKIQFSIFHLIFGVKCNDSAICRSKFHTGQNNIGGKELDYNVELPMRFV